ncbi:hypothetical protein S40293_07625 [Stachybotrys chartarum IBT 40293]|nr:hypothetical protein S40293_07625 [Stachybotrys chartarum IBT 40293]
MTSSSFSSHWPQPFRRGDTPESSPQQDWAAYNDCSWVIDSQFQLYPPFVDEYTPAADATSLDMLSSTNQTTDYSLENSALGAALAPYPADMLANTYDTNNTYNNAFVATQAMDDYAAISPGFNLAHSSAYSAGVDQDFNFPGIAEIAYSNL